MSHTILIVEDEPGMADVVACILRDEGYRVLHSGRADTALSNLRESKPDLIISDVMMPGMSGFSFYRQVRAEPHWAHIPFIFLTARGQPTDVRIGMGLGADDYLTKPFEPEDLLIAVQVRLQRAAELVRSSSADGAESGVANPPASESERHEIVGETA
jgi:DNA-binding response OmpR family regulator